MKKIKIFLFGSHTQNQTGISNEDYQLQQNLTKHIFCRSLILAFGKFLLITLCMSMGKTRSPQINKMLIDKLAEKCVEILGYQNRCKTSLDTYPFRVKIKQ